MSRADDGVRHIRVAVGIEVDGRRCGDCCRLFVNEDDRGNEPYCAAFGSLRKLKTANGLKQSHYRRNPDCLTAERGESLPW